MQAGSTTLATYSNAQRHQQLRAEDGRTCPRYAGQTVTLKFTGTEDSSLATSFLIDDTALNVS